MHMTLGTWLYTKFKGEKVGEDDYGNIYYRSSRKRAGHREERWVIYAGDPEASKVPPEWHAWLHHTTDEPITTPKRAWQKPHVENVTGTEAAYLPPGHDRRDGERSKATGDYEAWTPNG
jgi:NADH:ubiquinone oxidoreductase subunit